MKYKNVKCFIKISIVLFLIIILFSPKPSFSYNKSWDQGHQGVNPGEGEEGPEDTPKTCCAIDCEMCPIYANTGFLYKSFTDLSVPGIGPSLNIIRTYNSKEWTTSLLGHSWIFNFGRRLIISRNKDNEKILGVLQETGEKNFFKEYPDGTLESLEDYGVTYELVKNPDNTYAIKKLDGSMLELNEDGKIEKSIDKNGNELIFEYNLVGCLSKITNTSGNYVTFQLGPNGKIASISDNLGRTINYGYDQNGNLISITDPLGNTIQYNYDSKNRLIQIIDPRGNSVFSVAYNNDNKVSSFTEKGETYTFSYFSDHTVKRDSSGNTWTYYFNDVGIIEKIIDPLGNIKQQHHNKVTALSMDWKEDLNGNRTTYTYDEYGNITSKTDPLGNTWTYTYIPGSNLIVTETNPVGVVTKYEYDSNGNRTKIIKDFGDSLENTTSYAYDSKGNLLSETDPLGHKTSYEYDNGNLIKVTDPLGNSITYTYDNRGNKVTRKDALGNTFTYTYDLMDRLVKITNPLGNITSYTYDANGNQISVTDANGNTTTYSYDAYNRLIQKTDPLGNKTSYAYDSRDNRISITDANGNTTTYIYDILDRLVRITDPLGEQINFVNDANRNIISITNANGNTTQYQYDNRDRLIKIIDPLGNESSYTYDYNGKILTKTNSKGATTTYEYDPLGRLIKEIDPLDNHTTYTYDYVGNLISLTDANGQTTYFTYNQNGQKTSETRPMGQKSTYTYDAVGNLSTVIDAKDQMTVYTYNEMGMKTSVSYHSTSDSTTPQKTVDFTYDDLGNLTSYNDDVTSATYTYDILSRKTNEAVNYGAFTLSYSYAYNADWTKQSLTYPDGITYTYGYSNGQLNKITIPGVADIAYTDYQMANPTKVHIPGGTVKNLVYDQLIRLEQIKVQDFSGTNLMNYTYTRDGVGNITNKVTEHGDYGYIYDNISQLLSTDNPGINDEAYTYDNVGNRLTDISYTGNWTYNNNNHLIGFNGLTYQYDDNGNTIQKDDNGVVTYYFYNLEDHLERAEDGSGTLIVTYYYDPMGRRLKKDVGGVSTYYFYSDEGLIGEYNASGNEIKTYGYTPDSTWTTDPVFMKEGGNYYYYLNDHLGTPKMLVDGNGSVVWAAKYSSLGKVEIDPTSTIINNLRFPGQYDDAETGFYYNWHRYYDPLIGRYLTPDPIGFISGDLNLYRYVNNNPSNLIDPIGLAWSNIDALDHYRKGGGDVSLRSIGHYATITKDVQPEMNNWKDLARKDSKAAASILSCPNVTSTTISKSDSVGVKTSVFWIGGISFFRNYWCSIDADCCKMKYYYTCYLTYSMSDPFKDPWDIFNWFKKDWDTGTPYNVTASWSDTISGTGNL